MRPHVEPSLLPIEQVVGEQEQRLRADHPDSLVAEADLARTASELRGVVGN